MASYINRTELLNKFNLDCRTAEERYSALAFAPAADVVPVVHGEWKIAGTCDKEDRTYIVHQCSHCGIKQIAVTNYCPNCGAKMDKEAATNGTPKN